MNNWQRINKRYWKFFAKFIKLDLTKKSNHELVKIFNQYCTCLKPVYKYFGLSQQISLDLLLEYLLEELAKEGYKESMGLLITQVKPDIIFREEYDLLEIKKSGKISDEVLYQHALKYSFLFYNSYDLKENLNFLRNRANDQINLKKELVENKLLKQEQEKIFKRLKNKKIKEICLFFQNLGIERLEQKNCWAGGEFRFLNLFREIAKRAYVPLDMMMGSFVEQDYFKALQKDKVLTYQEMKKRMDKFIFWKKGNKLKFIEDDQTFKKLSAITKGVDQQTITKEVSGMVANGGVARGKVRIVQSVNIAQVIKDLERFNQGDILVTWMTQPNMVPIARKAGAIVADEGGITSHAAIIAREFGIPCIVGAKIATKMFKEGDLVEVDANQGIIKKLE